jgi:hypothetical protein
MKEQPSVFTRYELSEAEELTAAMYSYSTFVWLKNQQATIAEQKLALKFDPLNPTKFAQEEAYLAGQLDLISYILAAREAANNQTETTE